MMSTDAMVSEATTHVDPHNSANWMIDFVCSSMKPTPRKKKCHGKPERGVENAEVDALAGPAALEVPNDATAAAAPPPPPPMVAAAGADAEADAGRLKRNTNP